MIPMPADIRISQCNEPCDFAEGPCACGAWHSLEQWKQISPNDGTLFAHQYETVMEVIRFLEREHAHASQ